VALRVALRAAPTPVPTVSLIDELLRVAVRTAPGWDEDVPWVEPERDEQDVRDAQIAQEQQGQQEQQAQTERMSDRHRVGRKGWRCVIGRGCARNGTGRNTE
jgi:hypothetical protein